MLRPGAARSRRRRSPAPGSPGWSAGWSRCCSQRMLLRKSRRGAEQAGLGMGDQFDGDRIHQALKAPLGGEALAETRIEQMVLEPEPEPAGDAHALRPVCEREIARARAERGAEATDDSKKRPHGKGGV